MSAQNWANQTRVNQAFPNPEKLPLHPREVSTVDTVSKLLEGDLSPDEAAETLTSLYDPYISTDRENGAVYSLWAIVASAARNLGHVSEYTNRLVALLGSISNIRKVDENGETLILESQIYWKDLPGFYYMFREYCMDWNYDDPEEEATRLLSGTTFAATFFTQGGTYMHLYMLEALRNGVESPLDTPEHIQEGQIDVPLAATWILLAGNELFEYCRQDHERGPPMKGANPFLWKGDQGYSLERWAFWKQRFYEISHAQALNVHARTLASKALSQIKIIESSGPAS